MNYIIKLFFAFVFAFSLPAISSANSNLEMIMMEEFEHGGGCRKSSPPGQCCHMERATGIVHCH